VKDINNLSGVAGRAALGCSTAFSLLERVRAADNDAWSRLAQLYGPLIHYWARRNGLGDHDAADIVQEVFQVVHKRIHDFKRVNPGDSFRKWLKAIANNKIREHWRRASRQVVAKGGSTAQLQINQIADHAQPTVESCSQDENPEDGAEVSWLHRRAMALIRNEFSLTTWHAFRGVVVEGREAAAVAADLGISRNAVYISKSRVLSRLRMEFVDLLTELS